MDFIIVLDDKGYHQPILNKPELMEVAQSVLVIHQKYLS